MLLFAIGKTFGQSPEYYLNFENSNELQHLSIDTSSDTSNIWQVGSPQKTIFSSAFSLPNVIVTDLLNPYPINDTSVFMITNIAGGGFDGPHTATLEAEYSVNSDSTKDYGTIEFSPDKGSTWIDLITTTAYAPYFSWPEPKPILTGNSNGWKHFYVNLAGLGLVFNIQYGDTVLYRFTFITDSIQTNKDGLMFDNFHFIDYQEGIKEVQNDNLISLYPNPTPDLLTVKRTKSNDKQTIQILNYSGQVLYENQNFTGEKIETKQLNNGVYLLKYSDTNSFSIKKFIINH